MEKHHKKLEDALDTKSSQLLRLKKAALQQTERPAESSGALLQDALRELETEPPEHQSAWLQHNLIPMTTVSCRNPPQETLATQLLEDTSSEVEAGPVPVALDTGMKFLHFSQDSLLSSAQSVVNNGKESTNISLSTKEKSERHFKPSWILK